MSLSARAAPIETATPMTPAAMATEAATVLAVAVAESTVVNRTSPLFVVVIFAPLLKKLSTVLCTMFVELPPAPAPALASSIPAPIETAPPTLNATITAVSVADTFTSLDVTFTVE